MLLEQNNIPFGPLAKIESHVEKLNKNGTNETPNISHEIPLTPMPTVDLASKNRTIESCEEYLSQSVTKSASITDNLSDETRSNVSNENLCGKSPPETRTENDDKACAREPNKINQNTNRNAKFSTSTLSDAFPRFQPINISSERKKVLSQSIVGENANHKETASTSETIEKNSTKSRPKVTIKHIVLKRE